MAVSPVLIFQIRADINALLLKGGLLSTWDEAFLPVLEKAKAAGLYDEIGEKALLSIIDQACKDVGVKWEEAQPLP